MMKYR